ncbi:hypothetical protein F2Q68_00008606 [Brassica cretica]|uniref:Uncharacterized protein n=1 Tax=Brassica cretica TaxID=69181 RepID=A0A8S9KZ24_BRACR|nr:hypothetical protein F2Q68_00008606 [Brassica cretica]
MGGSATSDLLSGSSGTWAIASSLPRSPLSTDDAFKSSRTPGGAPSLDLFWPLLSVEESDNSTRSSRPGHVSLPSAGRTGSASPGPTSRAGASSSTIELAPKGGEPGSLEGSFLSLKNSDLLASSLEFALQLSKLPRELRLLGLLLCE